MNLNDVHRGINETTRSGSASGRGIGSGHGKTAGRGHKGQRSRAGFSLHPTFEGGQMPLVRRIPETGLQQSVGRRNASPPVNVGDLDRVLRKPATRSLPETLQAKNLA